MVICSLTFWRFYKFCDFIFTENLLNGRIEHFPPKKWSIKSSSIFYKHFLNELEHNAVIIRNVLVFYESTSRSTFSPIGTVPSRQLRA